MSYYRTHFFLFLHLLAACLSSIVAYEWYVTSGMSALWFILVLFVVVFIYRTFALSLGILEQAQYVIHALANGDSSIPLKHHHPLNIQFKRAQNTMQQARFTAERKHQFLQSTLLHIDLAILVCDDQGKILEKNPAVAQLIGRHIGSLQELGDFGEKILTAEASSQLVHGWQRGDESDVFTVYISRLTIQGQSLILASLQSIKSELQQKEQQAYKQLSQVITHEVANSVTPLSSLAETCLTLLSSLSPLQAGNPKSSQPQEYVLDAETRDDMCLALSTMEDRAQHLMHFTRHLKDLNRLPSPNIESIAVDELLKKVIKLFEEQCRVQCIELVYHASANVLVALDKAQIEQVLINLIKNAIEAVELKSSHVVGQYQKSISVSLNHHDGKQWYVEVLDNGNGITESTAKMMFVPFFTTKPEGSGIGLALSRQIMMNHGGDLVYVTQPDGACFRCMLSA